MRHMCILESTAHLSFHAHSIHTPMTGIPELSPPIQPSKQVELCTFVIKVLERLEIFDFDSLQHLNILLTLQQ